MSDNTSFLQLTESIKNNKFLSDLPDLPEDERAEIEQYLQDLTTRCENKFDAIIGLIKKCDVYIDALNKEMDEIKANKEAWKKNKDKITNIIKFAFQQNLISSTPTGVKYQATIKPTTGRLVDNFEIWDENERSEFGLKKITTTVRIKDETIVEVKEEQLPDKARLKAALVSESSDTPVSAHIVPSYSLIFERRKRLTSR